MGWEDLILIGVLFIIIIVIIRAVPVLSDAFDSIIIDSLEEIIFPSGNEDDNSSLIIPEPTEKSCVISTTTTTTNNQSILLTNGPVGYRHDNIGSCGKVVERLLGKNYSLESYSFINSTEKFVLHHD